MKKIRPLIVLILIAAMVFSLAACGSKSSKDNQADPEEQSQDAEPEHDPGNSSDSGKDPSPNPDKEDDKDKDPKPDKDSDSEKEPEPDKEEESEDEQDTDKEDEPDEEPLPEPDLSGDYYGEFSSSTGTSLDLIVKWAAEPESDGSYTVTLGFYLDSYSLEAGGRDGNTLTVTTSSGTKEFTFSTDDIDKKTDEKTETFIGGGSIRLTAEELAAGADATFSWDFRGSYSGTDLPVVTASGTIQAY